MKESTLEILRCPCCHSQRAFELDCESRDTREVRRGVLRCRGCRYETEIDRGIVQLMPAPPGFVVREAAGLERFAETMRQDGWDRERILRLPYEEQGYWFTQATAMQQILDTVAFEPGDRILDVGSNTCWASAMLAEHGLQVVALDIALHELQGLRTADWWFDGKSVFFERILGLMFDLPIADHAFEFVFCSEVLHHNDRRNLYQTFAELFRVLKPGGRLLIVNETLRSLRRPRLKPGKEVAEYEGHEHAFVRRTYTHAARTAGFRLELLGPRIHGIFRDDPWTISRDTPFPQGLRLAAANAVRRSELAKRIFLAYKAYVVGDTSLYMLATKPSRPAREQRPLQYGGTRSDQRQRTRKRSRARPDVSIAMPRNVPALAVSRRRW
jgi:SAM-dependent methyltransferase/uncharacterized protein YbaR (Trm112 family)